MSSLLPPEAEQKTQTGTWGMVRSTLVVGVFSLKCQKGQQWANYTLKNKQTVPNRGTKSWRRPKTELTGDIYQVVTLLQMNVHVADMFANKFAASASKVICPRCVCSLFPLPPSGQQISCRFKSLSLSAAYSSVGYSLHWNNGWLLFYHLSVQSSQWQHVVAAEPREDDVYPGLEALQAALHGAAGCRAGPALPGSALLLSALGAQPQALQHCWMKPLYVSVLLCVHFYWVCSSGAVKIKTATTTWFNRGFIFQWIFYDSTNTHCPSSSGSRWTVD